MPRKPQITETEEERRRRLAEHPGSITWEAGGKTYTARPQDFAGRPGTITWEQDGKTYQRTAGGQTIEIEPGKLAPADAVFQPQYPYRTPDVAEGIEAVRQGVAPLPKTADEKWNAYLERTRPGQRQTTTGLAREPGATITLSEEQAQRIGGRAGETVPVDFYLDRERMRKARLAADVTGKPQWLPGAGGTTATGYHVGTTVMPGPLTEAGGQKGAMIPRDIHTDWFSRHGKPMADIRTRIKDLEATLKLAENMPGPRARIEQDLAAARQQEAEYRAKMTPRDRDVEQWVVKGTAPSWYTPAPPPEARQRNPILDYPFSGTAGGYIVGDQVIPPDQVQNYTIQGGRVVPKATLGGQPTTYRAKLFGDLERMEVGGPEALRSGIMQFNLLDYVTPEMAQTQEVQREARKIGYLKNELRQGRVEAADVLKYITRAARDYAGDVPIQPTAEQKAAEAEKAKVAEARKKETYARSRQELAGQRKVVAGLEARLSNQRAELAEARAAAATALSKAAPIREARVTEIEEEVRETTEQLGVARNRLTELEEAERTSFEAWQGVGPSKEPTMGPNLMVGTASEGPAGTGAATPGIQEPILSGAVTGSKAPMIPAAPTAPLSRVDEIERNLAAGMSWQEVSAGISADKALLESLTPADKARLFNLRRKYGAK